MTSLDFNGPPQGTDRRSGLERRVLERRRFAVASVAAVPGGRERRRLVRRQLTRRTALDVIANVGVTLFCPDCQSPLEYEAFLSWVSPGAYTVDAGYCPSCSQRFLRNRETDEYDRLSWTPLCRICREPVGYARRESGSPDAVVYCCRTHANEEWHYSATTGRWTSRVLQSS